MIFPFGALLKEQIVAIDDEYRNRQMTHVAPMRLELLNRVCSAACIQAGDHLGRGDQAAVRDIIAGSDLMTGRARLRHHKAEAADRSRRGTEADHDGEDQESADQLQRARCRLRTKRFQG